MLGLLLLPAVAMRYSDEVNWDRFDFMAAALLLGGPFLVGLWLGSAALFAAAARRSA
ncbi:hypothetical protein [Pseudomarimonas arenosa]|uniref:Uncharacterized protein n=1 Tax=Pseudomarimonas arenosa TaxID=2774145 RepID=A0AAW3ZJK8_9GAMM|nr:hypothetical protein [Pseudomarimonas arenosa]MBD8524481.1 hypothetical protein [Pseudomarimonas arenosa]